ncbi:MAG: hypothetical protein SFX74_06965 [Fimbriimonadaceae bacterium]|nr:hypothetical protein [Fimbriimonadaceae bacterium]
MRAAFSIGFLAIGALVSAQAPGELERVHQGMSLWRGTPARQFTETATVQDGPRQQTLRTDLYIAAGTQQGMPVIQVELVEYRQRPSGEWEIANRIYTDGVFLHRYDARRREVSSIQYGVPNAPMPEGGMAFMLNQLGSAPTLNGSQLLRLVRDLYAGPAARYSNWIPGEVINGESTVAVSRAGRNITFSFGEDGDILSIISSESRPVGAFVRTISRVIGSQVGFNNYPAFQPWTPAMLANWRIVPWVTTRRPSGR